jgi:hypothetical protein
MERSRKLEVLLTADPAFADALAESQEEGDPLVWSDGWLTSSTLKTAEGSIEIK